MIRPARLILWLVIIILMIAQALAPATSDTLLRAALLDAGHVPLFGLLALAFLRGPLASFGGSGVRRIRRYVLAFGVVLAVGVLTEALQVFVNRDADLMDLARNLLGGGAVLLAAMAVDAELSQRTPGRRWVRPALLLAAVACLGVALRPAAVITVDYLQRNAAFPRICDFQSSWGLRFVEARDTRIEVTEPPAAWGPREGREKVAHVTFLTGSYPALIVREPYPDWTAYSHLSLELFSENPVALPLAVRVNDAHHANDYADRFNRTLSVEPGANRFLIPLREVRNSPATREMDMARIRGLALFAVEPLEPISVYVGAIGLETD